MRFTKNFCNSNSENCNITYSNIDTSNEEFLNIDLQKDNSFEIRYDFAVIFNVLEHVLNPNLAIKNLSKILKKMEKLLDPLHFYLGFMVHQKIIQDLQKIT